MNIYVCIKHVPDSGATITVEDGSRISENVTYLINPYDEHAITEAVKLKTAHPDNEVVTVCLGKAAAEETLRSAMAMGADRSILVVADKVCDSILTARALKAAITADGEPDLIMAGKESIDSEGMQTFFRLAESLDMPAATNVVDLDIQGDMAVVECERGAGTIDVIQMMLPCVTAVGKGINNPKYPTFPDIVKARKKEIRKVDLATLDLESPESEMEILYLAPAVEERNPEAIEGSAPEIARQIVEILKTEAKVI